MFWQFEDGRLVNLNIFEDIGFFEDAHTGVSHVRGELRNGRGHIDLFSSKDEKHVHNVLKNIGDSLNNEGALVRESIARLRTV